jgi:hypothetical protein
MEATPQSHRRVRLGLVAAATTLAAAAFGCGPTPAPAPPAAPIAAVTPTTAVGSSSPTTTSPTTTPSTTTPSTTAPTTTSPTTTAPTTTAPTTTTTAPSSGAANVGRVGVNTNYFWFNESTDTAGLQPLPAAGVTWTRDVFDWRTMEPTQGQFNWSGSDALVAATAKTGVNLLAILAYSAPWASSDPSGAGNQYYPPKNPGDYAQFASAVVQRYGHGGTFWATRPDLTPHPLAAVEIWNEPWGYWAWAPNPDPAAYGRLVMAAGPAIRAADPSVQIAVTGDDLVTRTDGAIANFVQPMLASNPGIASYVDAWSVHPYPDPKTNGPQVANPIEYSFNRVTVTQNQTAAAGVSRPIWITEIGWTTATGSPDGVSEAAQAQYVSQALGMALSQWRSFVAKVFVYTWQQDGTSATDPEAHFGLRRADGSMKPAWSSVTAYLK